LKSVNRLRVLGRARGAAGASSGVPGVAFLVRGLAGAFVLLFAVDFPVVVDLAMIELAQL